MVAQVMAKAQASVASVATASKASRAVKVPIDEYVDLIAQCVAHFSEFSVLSYDFDCL